jgi:hypothetical protein
MSTIAAGVWMLTLASGLGAATPGGWIFLVIVAAALLVPLAVMTALARSGRAAERRRDLRHEH